MLSTPLQGRRTEVTRAQQEATPGEVQLLIALPQHGQVRHLAQMPGAVLRQPVLRRLASMQPGDPLLQLTVLALLRVQMQPGVQHLQPMKRVEALVLMQPGVQHHLLTLRALRPTPTEAARMQPGDQLLPLTRRALALALVSMSTQPGDQHLLSTKQVRVVMPMQIMAALRRLLPMRGALPHLSMLLLLPPLHGLPRIRRKLPLTYQLRHLRRLRMHRLPHLL